MSALPFTLPSFLQPAKIFASLGNHVRDIVCGSAEPKMGGINAARVIATVTDVHSFRNQAVVQLIAKAMGKGSALILVFLEANSHRAITRGSGGCLPFPALVSAALVNLLPEAICYRLARRMPGNVAHVSAFNPSILRLGAGGNGCGLPTAAHAHAGWIRAVIDRILVGIVSVDVPFRLAFNPAKPRYGFLGNRCLLATTTVTITVWDFVRGIIGVHKKLAFLVPSHRAIPVAAVATLLVATRSIIARSGCLGNTPSEEVA